ncbi:MAG: tRNA lysidine(34) synthetase TilS [Rhodothermaceae bacterium]|nr:tRNA lysidine(34) synthetase TilS [Rhodothermaceae bacterium]
MKNLIDTFRDRVASYMKSSAQVSLDERILVGVSGGVDSVALLDVLGVLGYECEVVHINYHLREQESVADETLVRQLSQQRELNLQVKHISAHTHAAGTGCSVQMIARDLRYAAFTEVALQQGLSTVAVAHHMDDQAESLLLNLNRGTGPEGLAAMRPVRPLTEQINLVRPLLGESRASIQAYATARNLKWREDRSNKDTKYLRSRLRASVMPNLNAETLARSAKLVAEWVDEVIRPMIDKSFSDAASGQSLSIAYLAQLPNVLARRLVIEALRKWLPGSPANEALAERILGLVNSQTGKQIEVGAGVIWRDRAYLVFTAEAKQERTEEMELLSESAEVAVPGGQVRLYLTLEEPSSLSDPEGVWLDAEKLELPLTVRRWLAGDRMRPLGMQGTKKISDLLTDDAVPAQERSSISVVCSGSTIAWVVGHRMAHEFRVTPSTQQYARLYYEQY